MGRSHVHIPVTMADGEILLFADVTLQDDTGRKVTVPVYDGPYEMSRELAWPVTFAPANIDLWIDQPGRFDLHVVGPEGYSTIIRGVDFLPPPEEQVVTAETVPPVSTASHPGRWLRVNGTSDMRFEDPGIISEHTHDGGTANSTLLGTSVDSRESTTSLGYGSSAAGTNGTAVGVGSTAPAANSTVVGPDSTASSGSVTLGDNHGIGQPTDSVYLPFGEGGVLDAAVDSDGVLLRSLSSEPLVDSIGSAKAVPGSLPAGATRVAWIRGDLVTQNLLVEGDVTVGGSSGKVGFYGTQGSNQTASPSGATGVLADLVSALEAYGLISDAPPHIVEVHAVGLLPTVTIEG